MKLQVKAVETSSSRTAVFSLPLPPYPVGVKVAGAKEVQCVPMGEWPARLLVNPKQMWPWDRKRIKPKPFGNPPRRCLVYARFPKAAPKEINLSLTPGKLAAPGPQTVPVEVALAPSKEFYQHKDAEKGLYHYVKREDSVSIKGFGRELSLRLAFKVGQELRYWQWVEMMPVWEGPLTRALVVGGHLYAGDVDRPMTLEESKHYQDMPFMKESMISAKAFLVIHADGLIEMTAHFSNVQGYGEGSAVHGLPVVELSTSGTAPLNENLIRIAEGTAELTPDNRTWRWMPVNSSRIYLGRRLNQVTNQFEDHYVAGSEEYFVKGVGRSASCALALGDQVAAPRRYLPPPAWYKQCAEFGLALPERETTEFARLAALSNAAIPVFLRNVHPDGMSKGGIYRYLDRFEGIHELSMDGNESSFIFRGAYLRTSGDLYRLALESARHIADICVDHYYFNVHYHNDLPPWTLFSQIYLRFGGLVQAWLETGDPWYIENAEGVANRWIAINRMNQPRKNMGRDPEPVEGIMMLYDITGKDHYFQEAEKIALDVTRSLFTDFNWRCGHGVGPLWGINGLMGSPWNGSHMLAGLAEFLVRACPETSAQYDFLLGKARGMIRRLLVKLKEECNGFHRATGSFIPRRHFLVAYMARDRELMDGIVEAVRAIEKEFADKGEVFYREGHHCGGYLESPSVLRSLIGRPPPWEKKRS